MQSLASLMSLQQKEDCTGSGGTGGDANGEMSDVANMADVADDDADTVPQTCHEPILTDIRQLVSRSSCLVGCLICISVECCHYMHPDLSMYDYCKNVPIVHIMKQKYKQPVHKYICWDRRGFK